MCVPALIGFFYGGFQPHLDQMQHRSVDDPTIHRLEQLGVRKTIEVATEIGVNNFSMASVDQLMDMPHCVQRAAVCPIGILLRLQVRLEDWFE